MYTVCPALPKAQPRPGLGGARTRRSPLLAHGSRTPLEDHYLVNRLTTVGAGDHYLADRSTKNANYDFGGPLLEHMSGKKS